MAPIFIEVDVQNRKLNLALSFAHTFISTFISPCRKLDRDLFSFFSGIRKPETERHSLFGKRKKGAQRSVSSQSLLATSVMISSQFSPREQNAWRSWEVERDKERPLRSRCPDKTRLSRFHAREGRQIFIVCFPVPDAFDRHQHLRALPARDGVPQELGPALLHHDPHGEHDPHARRGEREREWKRERERER